MNLKKLAMLTICVVTGVNAQPELVQRHLTLFQDAAAELSDHYQIQGSAPWHFSDLPAQPLVGTCDVPNLELSRIEYPVIDSTFARGEQVNLYVKDPRLGAPNQSAQVVWRQPPHYGLRLQDGPMAGQAMNWTPGSPWADVLRQPDQWPGLTVMGSDTDELSLRCAVPGPNWQARYTALQRGDYLTLSFDALIQVPTGQAWGTTNLTLSNSVGRGSRPQLMRAMDMAESAGQGETVNDGVWRYRFDSAVEFNGGEQFTTRLWTQQVQIQRFHRLNVSLSAQRPGSGDQSVTAQRRWQLTNDQAAGLGRPLLPGQIRINADAPDYPLIGQTSLPNLAPGAIHWLELGPSQVVNGQVRRLDRQVDGDQIRSRWSVRLENSSRESVTIQLNAQAARGATVSGLPRTLSLAANGQHQLQVELVEPRRR